MTAIVAKFGSEAVAGFGVGSRIEELLLIVNIELYTTLTAFIGHNLGAAIANFCSGLLGYIWIRRICLIQNIKPAIAA